MVNGGRGNAGGSEGGSAGSGTRSSPVLWRAAARIAGMMEPVV